MSSESNASRKKSQAAEKDRARARRLADQGSVDWTADQIANFMKKNNNRLPTQQEMRDQQPPGWHGSGDGHDLMMSQFLTGTAGSRFNALDFDFGKPIPGSGPIHRAYSPADIPPSPPPVAASTPPAFGGSQAADVATSLDLGGSIA